MQHRNRKRSRADRCTTHSLRRRVLAGALALAALVSACSRDQETEPSQPPNSVTVTPMTPEVIIESGNQGSSEPGLDIRLAEGSSEAVAPTASTPKSPVPVATGKPLADEDVDRLLGELDQSAAPTTTTTAPPTTPATPATSAPTTTIPAASSPQDATTLPTTAAPPVTDPPTTPATAPKAPDATDQPQADPTIAPAPTTTTTSAPKVNFPTERLEPPPAGEVIESIFPPPPGEAPADPGDMPLEVVRYQPEGDVLIAPYLTVTFNQPMVPLATLADLDAAEVPVSITPAIEGRWRWVGAKTLRFEVIPDTETRVDRLPAATDYTVEIPAGTTSASGAELAETVSWTFSTPPPSIESLIGASPEPTPGSDQSTTVVSTEPVFIAIFDQRVDPESVIPTIELTAGDKPATLRKATAAEIDGDEDASDAFEAALPGRAVAFTTTKPLPTGTGLTLTIGPGVPSAEGSARTPEPIVFHAATYGPLEVAESGCTRDKCIAGTNLFVRFNNQLDVDKLDAERVAKLVTVEPEIPQMTIEVENNQLFIGGTTKAQTDYKVAIDVGLPDIYGQTTTEPIEVVMSVGDADPVFLISNHEFVITDPGNEKPGLTITSINHTEAKVQAWAIEPSEYETFVNAPRERLTEFKAPESWQPVFEEEVTIDSTDNERTETFVDLTEAFTQAGSQIIALVIPTDAAPESENYWMNEPQLLWVQNTDLAIHAYTGGHQLIIWATELETGEPVAGVPVELLGDGRIATTDAEGLAEVELTASPITGLYANAGDRVTFLPGTWQQQDIVTSGRAHIFSDRGIYQPGETAQVTGWFRDLAEIADGDGLSLPSEEAEVTYRITDYLGNKLDSGTTTINRLGGFNFQVEVPANAALGPVNIEAVLGDITAQYSFEVQEYRRPEYEVKTRPLDDGPYIATDSATIAVDASYYSGGPLPNAEVEWSVTTETTTYQPPNNPSFTFGRQDPWWIGAEAVDDTAEPCTDCEPDYKEFSGRTNGAGTHLLEIGFGSDTPDLTSTVSAQATVFDLNRQAWAARTDLVVHPAENYVGLRSKNEFVELGSPLALEAIVTDIDGQPVAGQPVEVTIGRLETVFRNGTSADKISDPVTCEFESVVPDDLKANEKNPMVCSTTPEVGGQYRITAVVTDAKGRHNRTEVNRWVSGSTSSPSRNVLLDEVTIVPEREQYQPGEVAKLLVSAPWPDAHGIVTVLYHGIKSSTSFTAETGSAVIEVPIPDGAAPDLTVSVEMVGSTERTAADGTVIEDAPPRPANAAGQVTLQVPPLDRTLDVKVTPSEKEVKPGETTTVDVTVTDVDGEPIADAQVTVVVVDEAVLALTDYELVNPLQSLLPAFGDWLNPARSRELVQLDQLEDTEGLGMEEAANDAAPASAGSEDMAGEAMADGRSGLDTSPSDPPPAVAIRTDFNPLAHYTADAPTSDDGTAEVPIELPDNLTRYRIMAVAAHGTNQFGTGESVLTARLPLQVRPSPPRLARVGDTFELPVVVHNQTAEQLDVDVALRTEGIEITESAGQSVTVPANDRIEVRFPIAATAPGTAEYELVAMSGTGESTHIDAAAGQFDIYTPATTEAFAAYGTIDANGEAVAIGQQVQAPTSVFTQFGELEINTSTTALQALTDALDFLTDYPYESTDATATRLLAVTSLRDVLSALASESLPNQEEINAQLQRDIDYLEAQQLDNGGWNNWARSPIADPWVSVTAVHSLVAASDTGTLPKGSSTLQRGLSFVQDIEAYIPDWYSERSRQAVLAYAVLVLRTAEANHKPLAEGLWNEAGTELEPDALAMIWPSITDEAAHAEIATVFANAATDTAGGVTFATQYEEIDYVIANSSRRTDAIILSALISEAPDSDLIAKTVAALMASRDNGRWMNVYENSFILLAMKQYFDTFEAVTPNMVARAWLGDEYVLEQHFEGRSTDRVYTTVPIDTVIKTADPETGQSRLILQNDGTGRLYYRLGLRYAPTDLTLAPRDEGFIVERIYEPVDDPNDVVRDADGSWHIKAGANVRVRVTMVADARRTNLALNDPLPAGLEAINPTLAVSQTIPEEPDNNDPNAALRSWWNRTWFEHQQLGAERVTAFTSILEAGTYDYTYIARATTPGTFVAPPALAEQVYEPETFGRSGTDRIVID